MVKFRRIKKVTQSLDTLPLEIKSYRKKPLSVRSLNGLVVVSVDQDVAEKTYLYFPVNVVKQRVSVDFRLIKICVFLKSYNKLTVTLIQIFYLKKTLCHSHQIKSTLYCTHCTDDILHPSGPVVFLVVITWDLRHGTLLVCFWQIRLWDKDFYPFAS